MVDSNRVVALRGVLKLLVYIAVLGLAGLWWVTREPGEVVVLPTQPLVADLANLRPGEHRIVYGEGGQYFVLYRDRRMLEAIKTQSIALQDPESVNSRQPLDLQTTLRSRRPERLVLLNRSPDNGCPLGFDGQRITDLCRGSQYDLSGRVLQNQLSRQNISVPDYRWEGETLVITPALPD